MDTSQITTEIILYISKQSQDDPLFGAIKLNKILFAVDFTAYEVWGRSLTGFTYVRQKFGPTPDPTQFMPLREALLSEKRAVVQTQLYHGKEQQRLVALDEPDLSGLDQSQRGLIDDIIREFKGFNASQLSDWTHRLLPWLSAEDREEIPYYMVFAMEKQPIEKETMDWAESIARKILGSDNVS